MRNLQSFIGYYILVKYLVFLRVQAGTAPARVRVSVCCGSCQPHPTLPSLQVQVACGRVGFARELAFTHPPALYATGTFRFGRFG